MNPSKIRFVGFSIPAVLLLLVWAVLQPRGSWAGIFWTMFVITSAAFFTVFYGGPLLRSLAGALGTLFMVGAMGVAARGSFDGAAYKRLSAIVTPYPMNLEYIEEQRNLPGLRRDQTVWKLKTSDSEDKISAFYADQANLAGWENISQQDDLILRGDQGLLVIEIKQTKGLTDIIYDLKTEK